jgi:hypothetical protein
MGLTGLSSGTMIHSSRRLLIFIFRHRLSYIHLPLQRQTVYLIHLIITHFCIIKFRLCTESNCRLLIWNLRGSRVRVRTLQNLDMKWVCLAEVFWLRIWFRAPHPSKISSLIGVFKDGEGSENSWYPMNFERPATSDRKSQAVCWKGIWLIIAYNRFGL